MWQNSWTKETFFKQLEEKTVVNLIAQFPFLEKHMPFAVVLLS